MTNSNRIKLTWISFLSYALTGALVIVTGMVMGNIADYFNLPVSSMSNTFTFLNAGILISIFLNAWPQPGAVLGGDVHSRGGQRHHHVDWYIPGNTNV